MLFSQPAKRATENSPGPGHASIASMDAALGGNEQKQGGRAKRAPTNRHSAEAAISRYARHGRELMGCKSPVRRRESKGEQHAKWSLLI